MTPCLPIATRGVAPTMLLAAASAITLALWLAAAHQGLQMDTGPLPVVERVAAPLR